MMSDIENWGSEKVYSSNILYKILYKDFYHNDLN